MPFSESEQPLSEILLENNALELFVLVAGRRHRTPHMMVMSTRFSGRLTRALQKSFLSQLPIPQFGWPNGLLPVQYTYKSI